MNAEMEPNGRFKPRTIEALVSRRLRTHGAVLIEGPKAAGKTTTARKFAASEAQLDQDDALLQAARVDPRLVLLGATPRLLDEYQLAPGLWNAVRGRIDDEGKKGLFILTGSSSHEESLERHTGARRIATVAMRTMSFFERDLSSGKASLADLLAGNEPQGDNPGMSVTEAIVALCVGGWPDNLDLDLVDALDANVAYLNLIVNVDVRQLDGVRRDPDGVKRLIAGYARNTATDASLRSIATTGGGMAEATLHDYLRTLSRLFLIEDQEAWAPRLRSRARLAQTPKRHLADTSLAVAALGATSERLLGPEIKLAGFLFESQVVHDLRVYADNSRAQVRFYRDNKGLEVDAIVEAPDGSWAAFEVKLGQSLVDTGATSLLKLKEKVEPRVRDLCRALVVVTPNAPTYVRPDGVIVTSLASLGP
ncbi:MAG TPA: DUF4143 domain-containing protein [Trueperaceae bacterium]|nr:DUF4143 domain-containing protein [Trueperaceae bacterium]